MFIDRNNLFCDAQLVAADGDLTNVIDLGPAIGTVGRNLNPAVKVFAQVVADLAYGETLTSLVCDLKGSNDGTNYDTIVSSGTVLKANIAAGVQLLPDVPYLVDKPYRFLKLTFDVSGTVATGVTVTGGIVKDGVDHITTEY